ncbi:ABC transporter permease [Labrys okinawensis]|uniref:ABC transporter permease n=1 Tax=Labrys okinawensis TaxID=346911 RepID=UPI0039BC5F7C
MSQVARTEVRKPAAINLGACFAALILGCWVLIALTAEFVAPYDPTAIDIMSMLSPPSAAHWFGTDQVGRDVLSRVIFASRIDLLLCIAGVLPSLILGTLIGLVSGYFGGMIDVILMRIYDLTIAFPFFVLVLAIVGILGPGLTNFIVAIAIVGWVTYARLVRAEVLTTREAEYVAAAQCMGFKHRTIIFRHILPNVAGPILGYAVSDAVLAMLAGASFGFLGLGAQPPLAEWGVMIAEGQPFVSQAWWICLFPGLATVSLGIGFVLLGDQLQIRRNPG